LALQVWGSAFGYDLTPEKCTAMNPWRRPRPACGCSGGKEEEEEKRGSTHSVFF
jgi:hypothetical protein